MSITELQVLEARLLLAQVNREHYLDAHGYDFMSEIEDSKRRLKEAEENLAEYLVEFNKTDLERLEERVEDAWVEVMAAEDAKESAEVYYTKRQSFYAKLNLELENLKEQQDNE
jgi:hypothetical protein